MTRRLTPALLCLPALALLLSGARPAVAQQRVDPPAKYAAAVRSLEALITQEIEVKRLPAVSVALVDDQQIVWACGFGYRDPAAKVPATAATVYRVGSVSKLFTDLAVMRLAEQGNLNIDAPVTDYLPDFRPHNPYDTPITLRQLMTHRSGLVREPPEGNYFDPTGPTLAETIASLNRTTLVLKPGSKLKYSNAAIAVVGHVLERTQGQPFAEYLRRNLLEPLGLKRSTFEATPDLADDLAKAVMWTTYGREFPAPTFELGMAPAGSMYTTVTDLARLLSVIFAGGRGPNGPLVKPETLEQMYMPQFAAPGTKSGCGLGFFVEEFDGTRRIGHGGAVYGFATEYAALPDEKLGAVVVVACDCANAVSERIADVALRHMLAVRRNQQPPKVETTAPLDADRARRLAGRYATGEKVVDLTESGGRLFMQPRRGGFRTELRAAGNDLMIDDRLQFGPRLTRAGDALSLGKDIYRRVAIPKPAPPPARWLGLIGEYGWDHNTLYILEKDGKLHALIEWFYLYPLAEESENVFKFPDFGLYHDEKLIVTRDAAGKATHVEAASVVFRRRPIDGEDGRTFQIRPERPVDVLRRAALAATPPAPRGELNQPDLVELTALDPTIKLDVRYATGDNFLGVPVYTQARAFLQRPAAEALVRAHRSLAKHGYGVLVHDGYRPWYVTKIFWDAVPPKHHLFVADPAVGSRHNRGCAVDLTLYDRATGAPVQMAGGYDEFSDRSYPDYPGGTSLQRWHRDLLRRAMEAQDFAVYENEWWHYDHKDWKKYPTSNVPFEEIHRLQQGGNRRPPG
jgi:CubicO group peptidase (beta-lactamase class C family)/D-alanyl-D-alanine dipeptidase